MSRFDFHTATPKLFQAMLGLAESLSDSPSIPPALRALVECRVSQLNGCSFCLRMHSDTLVKLNGRPRQLDMLAVWRSANGFEPVERAALSWAECLTLNHGQEEITRIHRELQSHFDTPGISELTCIVATMNAWNRLGIAQHLLA